MSSLITDSLEQYNMEYVRPVKGTRTYARDFGWLIYVPILISSTFISHQQTEPSHRPTRLARQLRKKQWSRTWINSCCSTVIQALTLGTRSCGFAPPQLQHWLRPASLVEQLSLKGLYRAIAGLNLALPGLELNSSCSQSKRFTAWAIVLLSLASLDSFA